MILLKCHYEWEREREIERDRGRDRERERETDTYIHGWALEAALFSLSLFILVLVGGSNFRLYVNARFIFNKVLHTLTASHSQQQSKFVQERQRVSKTDEHEISSSSSAPHPPEPQDPMDRIERNQDCCLELFWGLSVVFLCIYI